MKVGLALTGGGATGACQRDAADAANDINGLRDDVDALRSQRDPAAGQPGR